MLSCVRVWAEVAHLTALSGTGAASEDGGAGLHVLRHALRQRLQLGVRLGGQDLCGQHHGRLIAGACGGHDGQERHRCLATAHIPLHPAQSA